MNMPDARGSTRPSAFLAILAAFVIGACASTGGGAEADATLAVRVQNNLTPPTSLSVWLQPTTGTRKLIGVVDPSDTTMLRYDPTLIAGQYVLVGETSSGGEIASTPFSVSDAAVVTWDLTSNIATVTREEVP